MSINELGNIIKDLPSDGSVVLKINKFIGMNLDSRIIRCIPDLDYDILDVEDYDISGKSLLLECTLICD